ncbi:MAG: redoxin domain-containing protein [Candidatus Melainabacteria bacterium]
MHTLDTSLDDERFRAPALHVTGWLNRPARPPLPEPLTLDALRGRTVLVDFWDHTCINCRRTLPYLQAWHTRYAPHGLVILAIHAPEFPFAANPALIEAEILRLGIPYAVGLDGARETFRAWGTRHWPAKYLVDADGLVRAYHYGEGAYGEMESAIQCVLAENGADASQFPELLAPVRETDAPGALCYEVSPELYLGHRRGSFGNLRPGEQNKPHAFTLPDHLGQDLAYLAGNWLVSEEHLESAADTSATQPATLTTRFTAASVNAVVESPAGAPVEIAVTLDGQPLPAARHGADVREVNGETIVAVSVPGMAEVIAGHTLVTGKLALTVRQPGVRLYTLTFTTCVSQESAVC